MGGGLNASGAPVIERRHLLRLGMALAASSAVPNLALAAKHKAGHGDHHATHHAGVRRPAKALAKGEFDPAAPRRLAFHHLHTNEDLDLVYWHKGAYVPEALVAINHVLRDFRANEDHVIDPKLLDLVNELRVRTGTKEPFRVIGGYRSPQTNEMLRDKSAEAHNQSPEVAKKSLHMVGQAIDLRLNDVSLNQLHQTAVDLKRGGVGYYPDSDFIHVDVGAVRYWQGT
jgi:uncharacterized protein YcbK (DUF882 family)